MSQPPTGVLVQTASSNRGVGKVSSALYSCRGRPFKRPAKTSGEAADGAQGDRADLLPRLLMIVGVAVMALLVFKRLHVAA